MSKMLTWVDAGWESIRTAASHGRRFAILPKLRCLLAHPDLPGPVALEAHGLAAEILIDAERYREARRHLRAAAALAPIHAPTYYLLGLAQEGDPYGCDRLAAKCFRRASKLDPTSAIYQAAYGRAVIRCDRLRRGVRELLTAAEAAPGEAKVIRIVVEGLLEARRITEARQVLTRARFLTRGGSDCRELEALWEQTRFETACSEQRETTRQRHDAEFARDGGRAVLPFIRLASGSATTSQEAGSRERRDVVSFPRPHFPRMRARRV
jgi:predicted Zn-dependent protease